MNKRRMLWGVMMPWFAAAVLLLPSGSQSLLAMSSTGEPPTKVLRSSPLPWTAPLGALAIDTGANHTCAVTTLGGAQCWGDNSYGQLGNNSTTDSAIPVNVSGLVSGVTAIAAGDNHNCAVVSGAVKCWGDNSLGQLGDGSTTESHTPVSVSGLAGVTAIAAGGAFACAVTSGGTVKCWGSNLAGQLGNGSTTNSAVPVSVTGLSGVTAVSAGDAFACALTGGLVKCWGLNANGQLGDGTTTESHVPVSVSGLSGATAIATGDTHGCAVTGSGQVKCWGSNSSGELGNGTTTESHTPVLASGISGATAIAAGSWFTCAVAGGVKCWGYNGEGELGNNSITDSAVPVNVSGLGSGVVQIASGQHQTCLVTSTRMVKCWGDNTYGQLGNGEMSFVLTPASVTGLSSNIIGVGVGEIHSCALTSGGGVKCWGANYYGQLGNNSTTYSVAPVDVSGLTSGVQAIAVGLYHSCALTNGGGVKCWGYNSDGQLGNSTTTDSSVPVNVNGLGSGVTAIAAGGAHSCARLGTGSVKCWGRNWYGQLGDGSATSSPVPVDVSGLSGATAIGAGLSQTCAVAGGGAKCWGNNLYGQLGNNSVVDSYVPADVSGLASGVTGIAGGWAHTCAVTGGAKCWGSNSHGQLGNNSTTDSLIPVDVNGLAGITKIALGDMHSCALTSGGGVKCWGDNEYGELGNSSTTESHIPVNVSGLDSGVSLMAAGGSTTCAVVGPLSGGTAKCWGNDYFGQVGNGHMGFYPTPVDVLGLPGQLFVYLPIVLR